MSQVVETCLLHHADVPPRSSPDELTLASHFLPAIMPVSKLFRLYCNDGSKPQSSQSKYVNNQLKLIRSYCSCMLWLFFFFFCSRVSLMGQYLYLFRLCFTSLKQTILVLSQFIGQSLFIWCVCTCTQTRLNSPFFLLYFVKFYILCLTRALHSASNITVVKNHLSFYLFLKCYQIGDTYSLPLHTLHQLMAKYFHF